MRLGDKIYTNLKNVHKNETSVSNIYGDMFDDLEEAKKYCEDMVKSSQCQHACYRIVGYVQFAYPRVCTYETGMISRNKPWEIWHKKE